MAFNVNSIDNHREREKGVLVYPVYSRRSGGLSVGINLFPDKKCCTFNCPYCEVFPFSTNAVFLFDQMEEDLRSVVKEAVERNIIVKDICFSGNGESSLSPFFPQALKLAALVRDEMVPQTELVLISNSTGLLEPDIFSLLHNAVLEYKLDIWLKLDAGTSDWYKKLNCSEIPHEKLITAIKKFTACTPVTIQTMICAVDGKAPPQDEVQLWEKLILELDNIQKVQIYGKARPSPGDNKTSPLPVSYLNDRADSLQKKCPASKSAGQILVYP